MHAPAFALGPSLILVALLIIVVCIPLLKGRIGMNRWYGFRFPQSFRSDEHWYAINRYGARQMIIWAVLLLAVGLIVSLFPPQKGSAAAFFVSLSPLVAVLVPGVKTYLYGRSFHQGEEDA